MEFRKTSALSPRQIKDNIEKAKPFTDDEYADALGIEGDYSKFIDMYMEETGLSPSGEYLIRLQQSMADIEEKSGIEVDQIDNTLKLKHVREDGRIKRGPYLSYYEKNKDNFPEKRNI